MNHRKLGSLMLVVVAVSAVGVGACITTYNKPKFVAREGIPLLDRRADGCNVDVFEDGTKVTRDHLDIGSIVLEWPQSKLKEQGPEGAITTLKAAACEQGAFIIKDMRALSTGIDAGLVYEATLATLVENGRPINETKVADGGPLAPLPDDKPPEVQKGW